MLILCSSTSMQKVRPALRQVYDLMDTDLHQIIRSSQPLTDDHYQYFIYQARPCQDSWPLGLGMQKPTLLVASGRLGETSTAYSRHVCRINCTCQQQVAERMCACAHTRVFMCRSCAG